MRYSTKTIHRQMVLIMCLLFSWTGMVSADVLDGFELVPQPKSNWCWAACSTMVINYFIEPDADVMDVGYYIDGNGNNPQEFSDIVACLTHWEVDGSLTNPLSENQAQQEIDDYDPFIVGWYYNFGGGHVVTIYGYESNQWYIADPMPVNQGNLHQATWNWIQSAGNNGDYVGTVVSDGEIPLEEFIDVEAPMEGDEWEQGVEYDIEWTSNNVDNVKIELYKADVVDMEIAGSSPSDASPFQWTVPADHPPGNDYKLRISSTTTDTIFDESGAISIVESSVDADSDTDSDTDSDVDSDSDGDSDGDADADSDGDADADSDGDTDGEDDNNDNDDDGLDGSDDSDCGCRVTGHLARRSFISIFTNYMKGSV